MLVAEEAALHTDGNSYSARRSGQEPQRRADHPVLDALSVQIKHVQRVARHAQRTFGIRRQIGTLGDLNHQRIGLHFTHPAGHCAAVVHGDGDVLSHQRGSSSQVSRCGVAAPAPPAQSTRKEPPRQAAENEETYPSCQCHYALFVKPCQAVHRPNQAPAQIIYCASVFWMWRIKQCIARIFPECIIRFFSIVQNCCPHAKRLVSASLLLCLRVATALPWHQDELRALSSSHHVEIAGPRGPVLSIARQHRLRSLVSHLKGSEALLTFRSSALLLVRWGSPADVAPLYSQFPSGLLLLGRSPPSVLL